MYPMPSAVNTPHAPRADDGFADAGAERSIAGSAIIDPRRAGAIAASAPLSLRQWVVTDVSDDLLPGVSLDPIDELRHSGGRRTSGVEVQKAADRIAAALSGFERRGDGGCGVVLLDLERTDAFQVRNSAVPDAKLIAPHGVHDG